MAAALASAIYEGVVRHRRHAPVAHAFRYRLFQPLLDLGELDRVFAGRWFWSMGRRNLAEFRRSDYFGDATLPLDLAVRRHVEAELGRPATGPIRLLTHLRYFGYVQNPVSFYYGYREDGATLDWILAEITNTPWGERHAYLLPVERAEARGRALHFGFDKAFHVSPFLTLGLDYRFRLLPPDDKVALHIAVSDDDGPVLFASLAGDRRPLTDRNLLKLLLTHPLLTLKVTAAIHWHALLLLAKRVKLIRHPGPPAADVTVGRQSV